MSPIMKGMCKSYKAPNEHGLGVKLKEAKEKADKHDLKYNVTPAYEILYQWAPGYSS